MVPTFGPEKPDPPIPPVNRHFLARFIPDVGIKDKDPIAHFLGQCFPPFIQVAENTLSRITRNHAVKTQIGIPSSCVPHRMFPLGKGGCTDHLIPVHRNQHHTPFTQRFPYSLSRPPVMRHLDFPGTIGGMGFNQATPDGIPGNRLRLFNDPDL